MHTSTRHISLLLAALLLTQCKAADKPQIPDAVFGAQIGVIQTAELLSGVRLRAAPGALLGLYIAGFMVNESGVFVQGAMYGVDTGLDSLLDSEESPGESFELLQQLGVVLQVNIPDMLNRSTDRQQTLDAYIDTLTQVYDRSKTHLTALKQQQTALLNTRREKRSRVVAIQHDLNLALQKKDYTTASVKQSEIVEAKSEQATADAEVNQSQSTITLYTNLNKVADRRLAAISVNREALIAGITVVDVPGIQELGVLDTKTGTRSGNNSNIFGN
ncbi:hypothetical protein K8942_04125 [Candidatus Peribacteria bacterium]|nr:MAG: hypothetical protein K8942_04125 [Candidatus Peribacteria bacterium]